MHRTIFPPSEMHMIQKHCFPWMKWELIYTAKLTILIDQEVAFDANPEMPSQFPDMSHQIRVSKSPVCQKDYWKSRW
jgi:hypothetical protein